MLPGRELRGFEYSESSKIDMLWTAQLDNAEKEVEDNIVAMNYYEIGVSEHRWKSLT